MREGYILFALFFFFANIGILQGETIHITSQAQSRRADRRRRGSSQHLLTLLKGTTNLTTTTTASSASTQRGEPSASTLMSRSGTGDSVMSDLTMYDVSNENHFDEDGASDVKVIRKDGWSDSDEESYISDDSSLDSSKFFSVRSPSGDDALHFKTSTGPIRSSSGSSISSADSMDSLDSSDSSVDDALFHDAAGDMNMELTGVALGRVLFENEMKAREPSMMSKLMKQLLMGSLNSAARLALGATTIDRLKDSEVSTHYDVHDMGCKFTAKFAADEDGPYFRVRYVRVQ